MGGALSSPDSHWTFLNEASSSTQVKHYITVPSRNHPTPTSSNILNRPSAASTLFPKPSTHLAPTPTAILNTSTFTSNITDVLSTTARKIQVLLAPSKSHVHSSRSRRLLPDRQCHKARLPLQVERLRRRARSQRLPRRPSRSNHNAPSPRPRNVLAAERVP
jgi:hypothetical protein